MYQQEEKTGGGGKGLVGGSGGGNRLQGKGWVCKKCGKRFKSLFWLDLHHCSNHFNNNSKKGVDDETLVAGVGELHCKTVGCNNRGNSLSQPPTGISSYLPSNSDSLGLPWRVGKCRKEEMEIRRVECERTVGICFEGNVEEVHLKEAAVQVRGSVCVCGMRLGCVNTIVFIFKQIADPFLLPPPTFSPSPTQFCSHLTCERLVTSISGMEYLTSYTVSSVLLEARSDVGLNAFGKVVWVVMAAIYGLLYVGGFRAVRAKGIGGKGNARGAKKKD
jgi:hypothetical protein